MGKESYYHIMLFFKATIYTYSGKFTSLSALTAVTKLKSRSICHHYFL